MPSFAHDLELAAADRALLQGVVRGEKAAVIAAVERFHPVILSLICHRTKDFAAALRSVDGIVRDLFAAMLIGALAPDDFARDADQRATRTASGSPPADESEAAHSMHGAAKLVRRRAAARAATHLPLDQFIALVLQFHADWPADQMIGIVAENRQDVQQALAAAHRAVIEAMKAGG